MYNKENSKIFFLLRNNIYICIINNGEKIFLMIFFNFIKKKLSNFIYENYKKKLLLNIEALKIVVKKKMILLN
jgi:hypothetical protein